LHLAVQLGYEDTVKVLISRAFSDAMINCQDETSKWSPLMHAINCNESKIAKILLQTGKCDVKLKDVDLQTPLHIEAHTQSVTAEVSHYLVKNGAEIEEQDIEGMTPFLRAVDMNNLTIAKFLYQKRCNTSHCDNQGNTALHLAAKHCHEEMITFLVRICCNLSVRNDRGETPLMILVQQRHGPELMFKMMKYLINIGSPINAVDNLGEV
jgi:ankyrin repeat protein